MRDIDQKLYEYIKTLSPGTHCAMECYAVPGVTSENVADILRQLAAEKKIRLEEKYFQLPFTIL